ncbi:restriction endonuclease subunit R [Okeania sp. SIO2C9]|uniref:restriction endonuclease subunit R n=1 Tax=Okeania sp. SIO2C9 TaxID=2607791 RepID=UPI0025F725E8|nr:restriction endonuclease subunit R [Okeania sp. SIO2C9]
MLEPVVKLVVLSPLLKWAGFYRHPFFLTGEKEVKISSEDEATIITGMLDILVFTPEFWVLVIEAKKTAYSLEVGIPQALAYMLASPNLEKPNYGFVTNGTDFIFLKLIQQEKLIDSESDLFSMHRRHNDLWNVLQILKGLSRLVVQM